MLPLLVAGLFASAFADLPRTVDFVDLERYMGRWYEIAALPNFFQRQCVREQGYDPKEFVLTSQSARGTEGGNDGYSWSAFAFVSI